MKSGLVQKIVIMFAFFMALLTLLFNLLRGAELIYSAFWALCVLFGSGIVIMFAVEHISGALLKHLKERQALNVNDNMSVENIIRKQAVGEESAAPEQKAEQPVQSK